MPEISEITQLLLDVRGGSEQAEARLLELVYRELKQIAARFLKNERSNHTLQPTALVHETYMRLAREEKIEWRSRTHFFAVAAKVMRRVLVDYARSRRAAKRGGGVPLAELPETIAVSDERIEQVLAVDEALCRLGEFDLRQSRIVEMRFFGGLKEDEIADVLGVSVRTVKRDWRLARAWLLGEMTH